MDVWSGRVELNKARSSPVVAVREKLPFTLTPFYPYLTRFAATNSASQGSADPVPAQPAAVEGAK